MNRRRGKWLLLGPLVLVLAACEGNGDNGDAEVAEGEEFDEEEVAEEAEGSVFFLLPEQVTPRWEGPDRDFFAESMAEYAPDVEIEFLNALNDASEQQTQAEQAVTQGADVLVIAAVDQTAASVIVDDADAADVPVIAYDRLIQDAPLDYFVTFDGEDVGDAQGQWLLEHTEDGDQLAVIHGSEDDDNAQWFADGYLPVLEDADRDIGYEAWTPGWDPADAQSQMEAALTELDNDVQGVLSANDGMAQTIIAALESQGMDGEVPVTGQDATVEGLQSILNETQGMTVFKDIRQQADAAAQLTAQLSAGEEVGEDLAPDTTDNGMLDVPSRLLEVEAVDDEDGVQMVIDAGFADLDEVCGGVVTDVALCEDA